MLELADGYCYRKKTIKRQMIIPINYNTIGRQNGTIEFLNSLYDVTNENIAYDGASFDKIFYDTDPWLRNLEFQ